METQTLTIEEIKPVLDGYIKALHDRSDSYEEAGKRENAYRESKEKFHAFLISSGIERGKNFKETFIYQGNRLQIEYKVFNDTVNSNTRQIEISSEPYDVIDLDATPFEKDASEKALLIVDLWNKKNELEAAKKKRESDYEDLKQAERVVINALGYRKPIKYNGMIFQVYSAGYYGERGLTVQDAAIKELIPA